MPTNDHAFPDTTSVAYSILETIAITGELPADQIGRLPGSDLYKTKLLVALRAQGLVHTVYRDKLRGHRLTAKTKDLLLAGNPERFSPYLTGKSETNQLKSEVTRRLRLHRMAESLLTMRNAGISVYPDEKPDVFYPEGMPEADIDIETPVFFTSREVKELGADAVGIRGSRMVGILLTASDILVVYNTGDALMKWDFKPEMRVKTLMRTALCQRRLSHQYDAGDIQGLVLGRDMELCYQLLTSTGGQKRNYFVLDGNYDSFLFLPNDHRGETVLRLLCNSTLCSALDDAISENLYEREPGLPIENDAVKEDGTPVLFAYGLDMPRITRFNTALSLHGRSGVLICFDFQADVLRRFCCDNVEIETIDFDQFEGRFFPLTK